MLAVLAGCSADPAVRVSPPTGPGTGCERLHHALPGSLDGAGSRDVTPSSTRTAAWGDPAVVLRCGVARPAGLTGSEVVEVERVEWLVAEGGRAYVFTTTGRTTYVQLRVPRSTPRDRATAPLVDLAPAVRRSIRRV